MQAGCRIHPSHRAGWLSNTGRHQPAESRALTMHPSHRPGRSHLHFEGPARPGPPLSKQVHPASTRHRGLQPSSASALPSSHSSPLTVTPSPHTPTHPQPNVQFAPASLATAPARSHSKPASHTHPPPAADATHEEWLGQVTLPTRHVSLVQAATLAAPGPGVDTGSAPPLGGQRLPRGKGEGVCVCVEEIVRHAGTCIAQRGP